MKVTDLFMNNLKAMGANPTATTDTDGNTVIKVNAPNPTPNTDGLMNFNDPWTAFFEAD